MENEGYAPSTISNAVGILAGFYRWCGEREVDAELGAGFNPAEGVVRPQVRRWRGAKLLSQREAGKLLRTAGRDESVLGRRDYAFLVARLKLGVPLTYLRELRWGQIEIDGDVAWVHWQVEGKRQRLPAEVWEAIKGALESAGRLAGMAAGDMVFAPLAQPGQAEVGNRAEDWAAGRCLSNSQLLANLKLYGRLAGIEEGKLNLQVLRRTAIRLRLEEGANAAEMQEFLDSREGARSRKYRLARLPKLPELPEQTQQTQGEGNFEDGETAVPERKAKPFKRGEGIIHGYYAQSQPPEHVAAVLEEAVEGLDDELVGLRVLGRGLLEWEAGGAGTRDAVQLWEAYMLTALRLGVMIKMERGLETRGKEEGGTEEDVRIFVERMNENWEREGEPTRMNWEAIRQKVHKDGNVGPASRQMAEEIAAMRYVLRNVFRRAVEEKNIREHIRLVEIYSSGCVRLAKMLAMAKVGRSEIEQRWRQYLADVLEQALREMGHGGESGEIG
jgi:integrase